MDPSSGAASLKIKWAHPDDVEPPPPIHSAELETLHSDLMNYLDEVLVFIDSSGTPRI